MKDNGFFESRRKKDENSRKGTRSIVYTSGSGGIFKAGIPVGSLRDLGKVEFYSDLSQLTFVKIINFNLESN